MLIKYLLVLLFFKLSIISVDSLFGADNSEELEEAENSKDLNEDKQAQMGKFRRWLRYDVECPFLTQEELELKILKGRCPPPDNPKSPVTKHAPTITTSTKKPFFSFFGKEKKKRPKKKKDGFFSHKTKEKIIRSIVGSNRIRDIDVNENMDLEVMSGSMITLKCDEALREYDEETENTDIIEWFLNGYQIKTSWFDWRIAINRHGRLTFWPIQDEEGGNYECLVNGKPRASINLVVVSPKSVILNGVLNYVFTSCMFLICIVILGCFIGNKNDPMRRIETDEIEEFLTQHVLNQDIKNKEKIADLIQKHNDEGDFGDKVDKAQEKSNRNTIIMLLRKPDAPNNVKKTKIPKSLTNVNNSTNDDKISIKDKASDHHLKGKVDDGGESHDGHPINKSSSDDDLKKKRKESDESSEEEKKGNKNKPKKYVLKPKKSNEKLGKKKSVEKVKNSKNGKAVKKKKSNEKPVVHKPKPKPKPKR